MRQIDDDAAAFLLNLLDQVKLSAQDPELVATATRIAEVRQQLQAEHNAFDLRLAFMPDELDELLSRVETARQEYGPDEPDDLQLRLEAARDSLRAVKPGD